jgi:hypothetical protein
MTTIVRGSLFGLLLSIGATAGGCSHAPGMVMGDTMTYDQSSKKWVPLIEYKSPDIDELTGIDPDEEKPAPATETPAPAETPPPAATPPAATTPPAKATTPPAKSATPPAKK